ncbi:MAG: hypothetical protein EP339_00215 [Gammaproteobacteria bacterium]|nr:MAG: hypothetical protein EP339_00215 [Gammaproteobacteria bacterium]
MAVLAAVPAVLIPVTEVSERPRAEVESVPPQLARLIEQVPPKSRLEPIPTPTPEPVPGLQAPVATTPVSTPPVAAPKPQEKPVPQPQSVHEAREVASRSGLLALKSQLAGLRASAGSAEEVRIAANVSAPVGVTGPTIDSATQVLAGSGGIREQEAPVRELTAAGYQVSKVEAPPPERTVANLGKKQKPAGKRERDMNNIRKVFDGQKTALYAIYRRELRQDPGLEGKVLLELVIEPDGSVSYCEVVSSELGNPALESRLASRVKLFNFGAGNVDSRKVRFPIDFLPG